MEFNENTNPDNMDGMDYMLDQFGRRLYANAVAEDPTIVERAEALMDTITDDQRNALHMVAVCSKMAISEGNPDFLTPAIQCLTMTGFFGPTEDGHAVTQRANHYANELWKILEQSIDQAAQTIVDGAESLLAGE